MKAGDIIEGKYEIVRSIGRGGMGVVYEARHLQLERKVAIKVLEGGGKKSKTAVQRFLNEARTAAAVRSDHIVDVLDVGAIDDAEPFLVMEYLEGESLARVIERDGRLSPALAVELLQQLCDALFRAHEQGIIHRDLKPDNVFLTPLEEGRVRAKVLDFGLAKVRDLSLTPSTTVLGTLYYMAPEQAEDSKHIDARADIYSLGAILYEMLCGRRPYVAETFRELWSKIMSGSPIPLREHFPDVDRELEGIVAKAMARDREDRFQTVRELEQALTAWSLAKESRDPAAGVPSLVSHEPRSESTSSPASGRTPSGEPIPARDIAAPSRWKQVLWYLTTLPLAWACLSVAFTTPRAILTALGLGATLPTALGTALGFLIAVGLTTASVLTARFWSRGIRSRWLQGFGFLAFPFLGLLLVLNHHLTLSGQTSAQLITIQSYARVTSRHADQMVELFNESYTRFLNGTGMIQFSLWVLATIILLGYFFFPRGRQGTPGLRPWWVLVICCGALVTACELLLFSPQLSALGPARFLVYLTWMLSGLAVVRLKETHVDGVRLAWRALLSGAVASVALIGAQVIVAYVWIGRRITDGTLPLDEMNVIYDEELHPLVIQGTLVQGCLALALFTVLGLSVARFSKEGGDRAPTARDSILALCVLAATAAPIPLLVVDMLSFGQGWTYRMVSQMEPVSLREGEDPSYYIDLEPQSLQKGREGLFVKLTGGERSEYSRAALLNALSGSTTCPEELSKVLQSASSPPPARCVTAVEARRYCEVLGKRLPTPDEWEASLGSRGESKATHGRLVRGELGEWTMKMVHDTPTFEVHGHGGRLEIERLRPDELSRSVGFRCAYSY